MRKRILGAGLLAAGALLLPATPAAAHGAGDARCEQEVDLDKDGVREALIVDLGCDGTPEAGYVDTDGDESYDLYLADTDGNGVPDFFATQDATGMKCFRGNGDPQVQIECPDEPPIALQR